MNTLSDVQDALILAGFKALNDKASKALAIIDTTGRVSFAVWSISDEECSALLSLLTTDATRADGVAIERIAVPTELPAFERELYEDLWSRSVPTIGFEFARYRRHDSLQHHRTWVVPPLQEIWRVGDRKPPVVAFTSYKGGVGRSTALTAFAVQRARLGERVVAIDCDFDAPGLSASIRNSDLEDSPDTLGVVDYLVREVNKLPLPDMRESYYAVREAAIVGSGEILVFPSGAVSPGYVRSLGRLSVDEQDGVLAGFQSLLTRIAEELEPDWILVDARSGLSETNAIVYSGIVHLCVVVATASAQTWLGMPPILKRLGGDRVEQSIRQIETLILQTLIPEDATVAQAAKAEFAERLDIAFADNYYADEADVYETPLYTIRDKEAPDAPSKPVTISYTPRLAFYSALKDVADEFSQGADFLAMHNRIAVRFKRGRAAKTNI